MDTETESVSGDEQLIGYEFLNTYIGVKINFWNIKSVNKKNISI